MYQLNKKLVSYYKEIIKITKQNNFSSIGITCIGMGIYKCPLEIGANFTMKIIGRK